MTTMSDFHALRNTNRRTPWHMDTRAIEHEVDNLRALGALGLNRRADNDRLADLHDELLRRYEPGSVIEMRIGNEPPRMVLVSERHADVKGGGPGFTGVFVNRDTLRPRRGKFAGIWGFDRQITRVVKP